MVDKPRLADGDYTRYREVGERRLREGVEVVERWHGAGQGLITARLGPHATDTCSGGLLRDTAAEARRLGVGLVVRGGWATMGVWCGSTILFSEETLWSA